MCLAQGTRGPLPPCIAPPPATASVLEKGEVGPKLAGWRAPRTAYVLASEHHTLTKVANLVGRDPFVRLLTVRNGQHAFDGQNFAADIGN
jgi:hypothetical protein